MFENKQSVAIGVLSYGRFMGIHTDSTHIGILNAIDMENRYPTPPTGELLTCGAVIGAATGLAYHGARLFPVPAAVGAAACALTSSTKP